MNRIFLIFLAFFPSILIADTWSFPAELNTKKFTFGDITIERIIDTRENQQYPIYQVKVFSRDEELANYRNLTFEYIQTFDNGNYIFAGSNSGLSRFAYFVINEDGGLVMTQVHSDSISYCNMSISIIREWLPRNIEIKEQYYGLKGIFNNDRFNGSSVLVDYGLNGVLSNDLNNYLNMLLINDWDSYLNMLLDRDLVNDPYNDLNNELYKRSNNDLGKSLSVARIKTCNEKYIDFLKL